jgi:hypothetical protein
MRTFLVAAALLATAIASPALAQRQDAQQRSQPSQGGTYQGYPLSDWYHQDQW